MNENMQTAGETATTNQFDAEICRLKAERDARFEEINQRIEKLQEQNRDLNKLRNLNQDQIQILTKQKDLIGKDYRQKIADVREQSDEYYCNRTSSVHYKRFKEFCDLHPEVLQMWREFRLAEEGGEQ